MILQDNSSIKQITPSLLLLLMKFRWIVIIIMLLMGAYLLHGKLALLIGKLDSLGSFAPLLFLLLYCLMSVLCLPTIILAFAGGALFGPWVGTLLNLLGATLGAACGFSISRYFKPNKYITVSNERAQKLIAQVERLGWKSVALLRLTPAMPYNLVNYALGLTQIKLSHFLIATAIFLIPMKIIVTYCGYYGVNHFDYGTVMHLVKNTAHF